ENSAASHPSRHTPALAIEYKAPHKLNRDEIVTGLEFEIQPEREVINKDGEGFSFASRSLAAAVVTQLFSYMIGKGIQYGYVCTGETFVFLFIPEDPTLVYYSVCVPNVDVLDGDVNGPYYTAIAQALAFILQALRVEPPPLSWYDAAQRLGTWVVEYEDVVPATPYKAQRWKGFKRSPIRTRSRCLPPDTVRRHSDDDDDDDEDDYNDDFHGGNDSSPSTTPNPSGRHGVEAAVADDARNTNRPYCTHRCLRGLAFGGLIDESCPNVHDHGRTHINRREFLRLIRDQLAVDRGHDADYMLLGLSGSRGSLFNIRLSSYGYTLVAKGVEEMDVALLRYENNIYNKMRAIQGKHVPVCVGGVDLTLPCYYDGGVFVHLLFLSWGGQPLSECSKQIKERAINATTTVFTELHAQVVLHFDAEPRNLLYDTQTSNLMVVDFERAQFQVYHGVLDDEIARKDCDVTGGRKF
ncbi:hypothetical protein EDB81DRAFT_897468, partial [Dactylonectria macrodidyma]